MSISQLGVFLSSSINSIVARVLTDQKEDLGENFWRLLKMWCIMWNFVKTDKIITQLDNLIVFALLYLMAVTTAQEASVYPHTA